MLRILSIILCLTATWSSAAEPKWDQSTPIQVELQIPRGREGKMVHEACRVAMARWAEHTGLTFHIVDKLNEDEVGIRFVYDKKFALATKEVAGLCYTRDDDSGNLTGARVYINAKDYRFPHPDVSLHSLVLHEFGHAIGLGHSEEGGIMFWATGLQTLDIKAAHALYGTPSATNKESEEGK